MDNKAISALSQEQQTMLDWALYYLALGIFILPMVPGKKMPHIKWANRTDQKPPADEARAWWRQWPGAQIGMATGVYSNIDVLDFDSLEAIPQFEILAGPIPPDAPTVRTGRGLHVFFAHSPGLTNRAKICGLDVDFRTTGGIVVLPPSLHKTGRRYQWERGLI
ncbi:MAG: bifunctional DNA primase/polymerase [Proteobacteria bacterium]|nr:bifunctional DNA primase/polymerase [Pseudomonadota bacterium]